MRKRFNRFINEKGISMPVVLMVIFVVTILGVVLYSFSQNQLLAATRSTESRQAEYLARSGIEAAVAWWKQEKSKPTGTKTFDRVYMEKDGNLTLYDPGEDKAGYVDVTVIKESDKTWTIVSNGISKKASKTIRANSCVYMDDVDLKGLWYDSNGILLPGPNIHPVKINDVKRNVYVHDEVAGVAVIGETGKTLRLSRKNNEDCRVGIGARSLYFNSYMDLAIEDSSVGFLFAAGEKIVFNDTLKIRLNYNKGGGVLVLYLPEGLGIPGQELITSEAVDPAYVNKVDPNAKYGYVYFKKIVGVICFWLLGEITVEDEVISNKAYYFPRKDTENEQQNGIVIFNVDDFPIENYNDALNDLINDKKLIPANTAVPKPVPEDSVVFFRN